jgi:hypothetical protein
MLRPRPRALRYVLANASRFPKCGGICYRNVRNGVSAAQGPLSLPSGSPPFRQQAGACVADASNIPFEHGSIRVWTAYVTGQNPSWGGARAGSRPLANNRQRLLASRSVQMQPRTLVNQDHHELSQSSCRCRCAPDLGSGRDECPASHRREGIGRRYFQSWIFPKLGRLKN